MIYVFITRMLFTGALVAAINLIARRSPVLGAMLAALPLSSLIAMSFIYYDTKDLGKIADFAQAGFIYILPTMPMFLFIPWALRHGETFLGGYWGVMLAACLLTLLLYGVTIMITARMGIKL
jgi:hypothetical protein